MRDAVQERPAPVEVRAAADVRNASHTAAEETLGTTERLIPVPHLGTTGRIPTAPLLRPCAGAPGVAAELPRNLHG